MRGDAEIKQDVKNEIRWSLWNDSADISVAVNNGTMWLAGLV